MMEVKVYKQKVKHLLYEQENNIAELKAENMVKDTNVVMLLQIVYYVNNSVMVEESIDCSRFFLYTCFCLKRGLVVTNL